MLERSTERDGEEKEEEKEEKEGGAGLGYCRITADKCREERRQEERR